MIFVAVEKLPPKASALFLRFLSGLRIGGIDLGYAPIDGDRIRNRRGSCSARIDAHLRRGE